MASSAPNAEWMAAATLPRLILWGHLIASPLKGRFAFHGANSFSCLAQKFRPQSARFKFLWVKCDDKTGDLMFGLLKYKERSEEILTISRLSATWSRPWVHKPFQVVQRTQEWPRSGCYRHLPYLGIRFLVVVAREVLSVKGPARIWGIHRYFEHLKFLCLFVRCQAKRMAKGVRKARQMEGKCIMLETEKTRAWSVITDQVWVPLQFEFAQGIR